MAVAVIGFWGIPNWPGSTGTYYFTPQESAMTEYRAAGSAGGRTEDDEGD